MPSIVWRGHLTFGLVSIPVKLYRAARRERVRMHYVQRTAEPEQPAEPEDSVEVAPPRRAVPIRALESEPAPEPETAPPAVTRVKQALVTAAGEEPIRRADLMKGFEMERDRYVVFDPRELKGLQRRTSPDMEIVRSVRLAEIDPIFFDISYYLVPDRGSEKAYAILYASLRATEHVALARVGMYGREHILVVRPGKHGMLAHSMFYVDEIRFESEFRTDVNLVSDKELSLANTFLEALEGPFGPEEFTDVYREELQAMIEAKRLETGMAAAPAAPSSTPVIDILQALKASIEMKRKPAVSETGPPLKAPARKPRQRPA